MQYTSRPSQLLMQRHCREKDKGKAVLDSETVFDRHLLASPFTQNIIPIRQHVFSSSIWVVIFWQLHKISAIKSHLPVSCLLSETFAC